MNKTLLKTGATALILGTLAFGAVTDEKVVTMTGLTYTELANIKAERLARTKTVSKTIGGDGFYEIVNTNKIEGGVEVFIRAWDITDRQIGFGDGTIDIERVKIMNPPVLVPDLLGTDYTRNDYDDNGILIYSQNYREDYLESLKQIISQTIKVKTDKHYGKIIIGKVGNTTTVLYSGAGDGYLAEEQATWAGARGATSATNAVDSTATIARTGSLSFAGPLYNIRRGFLPVDTSSLPDTDVISAATLELWGTSKQNTDNDGDDWIAIVETTQASNTTLVAADYDNMGTTELTGRLDITSAVTGAYNTLTLNASGIALISTTGFTKIGAREGHDVLNSAITASTANELRYSTSENAGTTQDPKLTITHAAPATAAPLNQDIIWYDED